MGWVGLGWGGVGWGGMGWGGVGWGGVVVVLTWTVTVCMAQIHVMREGKIWQVAADELKRWVKEESDEYTIHWVKVVTAKTIEQLGNGAVVRFASGLLGGEKGKKKEVAKRATEGEQDVTDASSSEAIVEAASGLV